MEKLRVQRLPQEREGPAAARVGERGLPGPPEGNRTAWNDTAWDSFDRLRGVNETCEDWASQCPTHDDTASCGSCSAGASNDTDCQGRGNGDGRLLRDAERGLHVEQRVCDA